MFGGWAIKPLPCLCIFVLLILSLFLTTLDLKGYFSTESTTFSYTPLIEQHSRPNYRGSHTVRCESPLKVYMYDLPRRFNLGMLKKNSSDLDLPWTSSKIPPWPQRSGLKKQHSIEYWMMVYLLGPQIGEEGERAAVRVADPEQADVFYVPFFASLSFNTHGQNMRDPETEIDKKLQIEVVDMLKGSKSWQRSGGRDHVIVIHHPNAFRFLRDQVNSSIFVVADFGRYPRNVSFLRKDVVAPYVHVVDTYVNDDSSDPFESRTTLLYFRGRIKRKDEGFVRLQLAKTLGNDKRVHFEDSLATTEGFEAIALVDVPDRTALTDAWKVWMEEHINAIGKVPPGNESGNTIWVKKRQTKPDLRLTPGRHVQLTVTLEQLIDKLVKENEIVVFIKGSRTAPQCGFSHKVLTILNEHGLDYESVNILDEDYNPGLRETLKVYRSWPTFPQVFIKGEFVGGADILTEMAEKGELQECLKSKK